MRLILLLCFLSSLFLAKAQEYQIKATISNEEKACDTDLKQFTLIKKLSNQDLVVFVLEDTMCKFEKSVSLEEGNYVLKIKSVFSQAKEISLNIDKQTNPIIELGDIKISMKVSEVEEVTITGIAKKFIQTDPEKTIVTVENNAVLESSTVYNAIIKIPGIIPDPGGGFTYSGQQASVFFEGIPSSLYGMDLDNLLRSLPATSVKKIELITNPGASYDANFSGAIIDIISHDKSFKWLSGSISLNTGINNNLKMMPTFILNGKAKQFTWNIQSNYSYQERNMKTTSDRDYTFSDSLQQLYSERKEFYKDQNYSVRGNLMSKLSKKSTLQVNAAYSNYRNTMDGNSLTESNNAAILPFTSDYQSQGNGFAIDAGMKYRFMMDTLNRKIEFASNYGHNEYESKRSMSESRGYTTYSLIQSRSFSDRIINRLDLELPFKDQKSQINLGAKVSQFFAQNKGAYRFNDSVLSDWNTAQFAYTLPFDYKEQNIAFYSEYKRKIKKKLAFTLGLRAEDFNLSGSVESTELFRRKFFNLYPSIHTLYRISEDMILTVSYSRKINLPNYSMYDPNFSGYYDSYTQNSGNKQLNPNFNHRSQAKFTVFDYLQLSFTHNFSNSINFSEAFVDSSTLSVNYSYKTYNNVQSLSGFFSLPVPFGFFTQGLDFFRQPVKVDEISFMYLYTDWNKTIIPGYNYLTKNKAQWSFGIYSQFILPFKIRLNLEYNFTGKGMGQITEYTQTIHEFEAVLSREFLENKWRVSFSFQDIFNSNRYVSRVVYNPLTVASYSKWDTQIIWLKFAYSFGKYERPSLKENAIPDGKGG